MSVLIKKTIYIDLDGVIFDIKKAFIEHNIKYPDVEFPQSLPGFFEGLEPLPGAIDAVNKLRQNYNFDVWIATAPSTRNPLCYTEKRLSIEKHFDYEFCKRLIICPDKSLLRGDYLIDDYKEGKGQERFQGELLHFGTEYNDWTDVFNYLNEKDKQ